MKLAAFLSAAMALCWVPSGPLYAHTGSGGIYTCTDASGVRITSDRLIPQCMDREQRVLGPSGVERQRIGPALTESEQMQRQQVQHLQMQAQQRLQEQRRRDQALLARYPDRAAHDAQRRHALEQLDALQTLERQRLQELRRQEQDLRQELLPYAGDAAAAPARLSLRWDELQQRIAQQQVTIEAREADRQRIHARFDEELHRLQQLWSSGAR